MNPFKVFSIINNYGEHIIFILIFLVIMYFFLRDFRITSKKSWIMLLGLSAMGGLFAYRTWKRAKILGELEKREKALNELEEKYDELRKKSQLTQDAYLKAKSDLDKAKEDAAQSILQAEKEYAQRVAEIKNSNKNKTGADILKETAELLKKADEATKG